MDGSRLLILILILIVAGVIGGAFIVEAIRKNDFGDQVSGMKPEQKISYDKPAQENSQITIDREILRTKSGQNILGPK